MFVFTALLSFLFGQLFFADGDGGGGGSSQGDGDDGGQGGQGGGSHGDDDSRGQGSGEDNSTTDDDTTDDADLTELQRKNKQLEADNKRYRDEKRQRDAAEEKRRLESLSESERLQAEAKAEKDRAERATVELRRTRLDVAVQRFQDPLNLVDPETVSALLQQEGEIEYDDDDKPLNVESRIKDLIRRKPHIVTSSNGDSRDEGKGRSSGAPDRSGQKKLTEAQLAQLSPSERSMARIRGAFSRSK